LPIKIMRPHDAGVRLLQRCAVNRRKRELDAPVRVWSAIDLDHSRTEERLLVQPSRLAESQRDEAVLTRYSSRREFRCKDGGVDGLVPLEAHTAELHAWPFGNVELHHTWLVVSRR